MDNTKLVSIIIPCYNCEKYIEKTLKSMTEQSYKNIEILVTDDCSSDNTYKILQEYAKKDSRIKLFKNPENYKIVRTLNNMISAAKGDYIARMDADDISDLKRIEKQVEFLEKNSSIDFCGTNALYIDETDRVIGKTDLPCAYEDIYHLQKYYSVFNHPSMCFRRSVLIENLYSNDYPYAEDYELWSRLLFRKKLKGVNLSENLIFYRIFSLQSSSKYKEKQMESVMKIMADYEVVAKKYIFFHCSLLSATKIYNYNKEELVKFLKIYFEEIRYLKFSYPIMIRYFIFCIRNRLIKELFKFVTSRSGIKTLFCACHRKICKVSKLKSVSM